MDEDGAGSEAAQLARVALIVAAVALAIAILALFLAMRLQAPGVQRRPASVEASR